MSNPESIDSVRQNLVLFVNSDEAPLVFARYDTSAKIE